MENPPILSEFEIVTLRSGIKSLRSLVRNETFHPVTGPMVEANILHVGQQRLVERARGSAKFVIWDVGLGAAANVIAAIEALQICETEIEIHSFDKTTAPLSFALMHANELGYVVAHEEKLCRLIEDYQVLVSPHIRWQLHLGDFCEKIKSQGLPAPHAIFYDPYSPVGNPEMWRLDHFRLLWNYLDPHLPCLLTNYTCSTAMRVALLLAGFFVGKGCVVGEKAETTIATNQYDLLLDPLDRRWLERVRNSTNSAPLRALTYSKARITDVDFEQLQTSPQFQL